MTGKKEEHFGLYQRVMNACVGAEVFFDSGTVTQWIWVLKSVWSWAADKALAGQLVEGLPNAHSSTSWSQDGPKYPEGQVQIWLPVTGLVSQLEPFWHGLLMQASSSWQSRPGIECTRWTLLNSTKHQSINSVSFNFKMQLILILATLVSRSLLKLQKQTRLKAFFFY